MAALLCGNLMNIPWISRSVLMVIFLPLHFAAESARWTGSQRSVNLGRRHMFAKSRSAPLSEWFLWARAGP